VAVELGSSSNNDSLRTSMRTHPSMRAFRSLRGCRDMLSLGTGTRMGHTTASHRKTSHRRRARPSGRRPTLPRVSTRCHPLASGTLRPRTSVSCRMRWRSRSCSRAAATSTDTARCRRPHRSIWGYAAREPGVFYATSGQGFAAQLQGHGLGQTHAHGPAPGHGHGQHARHLSLDPRAAAFHSHGQPMSQLLGIVG
jgi:hypothetical protein